MTSSCYKRLFFCAFIFCSIGALIGVIVWQKHFQNEKANNMTKTTEIILNRTITQTQGFSKTCYDFNTDINLLCVDIESNISIFFNHDQTLNCDNGPSCINNLQHANNINNLYLNLCLTNQSCDINFYYVYDILYSIGFIVSNDIYNNTFETKKYEYLCNFHYLNDCISNSTTSLYLDTIYYNNNDPYDFQYNDPSELTTLQLLAFFSAILVLIIFVIIVIGCGFCAYKENRNNNIINRKPLLILDNSPINPYILTQEII